MLVFGHGDTEDVHEGATGQEALYQVHSGIGVNIAESVPEVDRQEFIVKVGLKTVRNVTNAMDQPGPPLPRYDNLLSLGWVE